MIIASGNIAHYFRFSFLLFPRGLILLELELKKQDLHFCLEKLYIIPFLMNNDGHFPLCVSLVIVLISLFRDNY